MNANGYTDESLAHSVQMQERNSLDEKMGQDGEFFSNSYTWNVMKYAIKTEFDFCVVYPALNVRCFTCENV